MKFKKIGIFILSGLHMTFGTAGNAKTSPGVDTFCEKSNWITYQFKSLSPLDEQCAIYPSELEFNVIKQMSLFLRNSNGNIVAVLGFKKNGQLILNPEINLPHVSIDYSRVPPLKDMSELMCDNLWGKGKEFEGAKTYKLAGLRGKKIEVSIDLKFKANRANEYRVRMIDKKTADWLPIQSAEKLEYSDLATPPKRTSAGVMGD